MRPRQLWKWRSRSSGSTGGMTRTLGGGGGAVARAGARGAGCDGGLALSTGFADPTFTPPGSFDEGDTYVPAGGVKNLNHGKQSTAVYAYNSDTAIAALGYVGVQDTGMNAGDSSLLWRGLADADGGAIACKPGSDGVKVWYTIDGGLSMVTDKGDFSPGWQGVAFNGVGGPGVN